MNQKMLNCFRQIDQVVGMIVTSDGTPKMAIGKGIGSVDVDAVYRMMNPAPEHAHRNVLLGMFTDVHVMRAISGAFMMRTGVDESMSTELKVSLPILQMAYRLLSKHGNVPAVLTYLNNLKSRSGMKDACEIIHYISERKKITDEIPMTGQELMKLCIETDGISNELAIPIIASLANELNFRDSSTGPAADRLQNHIRKMAINYWFKTGETPPEGTSYYTAIARLAHRTQTHCNLLYKYDADIAINNVNALMRFASYSGKRSDMTHCAITDIIAAAHKHVGSFRDKDLSIGCIIGIHYGLDVFRNLGISKTVKRLKKYIDKLESGAISYDEQGNLHQGSVFGSTGKAINNGTSTVHSGIFQSNSIPEPIETPSVEVSADESRSFDETFDFYL